MTGEAGSFPKFCDDRKRVFRRSLKGSGLAMEFQDPDFWISLIGGVLCLGALIFWLWKGGKNPRQ
jgi:hypothetical protein